MRTINLEILRHGPPHNQLLSPLTQYLALCENHAAVTVSVPFEHAQFLHRLSALSYENSNDDARRFQLEDTGRELGHLLAKIPSLTAEINQRGCSPNGDLLHLRMVISASELALLPFELAISPNGFPGESRPLALQTTLPVCLTREVRQASGVRPDWTARPKILFAVASPPDVEPVPLESHLLALRKAVDPWMRPYRDNNEEERRRRVGEHLVILPNATIEQIREKCATNEFTHVHILAHGKATPPSNKMDYQYGLVLHDARDPSRSSLVDGRTLARALRTDCPPGSTPARPLVVTLASCNAGQVGSVLNFAGVGASVAHAIHAEGVPLVIASQFPLTFRGSVIMVESLYPGLLAGEDPRCLVHDLRGKLQGSIPESHDWASLVVYAAFDERYSRQLERFQVDQAHRRINAALSHADSLVTDEEDREESLSTGESDEPYIEAARRIETAKRRLRDLRAKALEKLKSSADISKTTEERDERARASSHLGGIAGRIAASDKRHAETKFLERLPGKALSDLRADLGMSSCTDVAKLRSEIWKMRKALLEHSQDAYWEAYFFNRSSVWALVQHLFVDRVLAHSSYHRSVSMPSERQFEHLWKTALSLSLADAHGGLAEPEIWARGNLIELRLLRMDQPHGDPAQQESDLAATGDPEEHIIRLHALVDRDSPELFSIARQIRRYAHSENGFDVRVRHMARTYAGKLRERV